MLGVGGGGGCCEGDKRLLDAKKRGEGFSLSILPTATRRLTAFLIQFAGSEDNDIGEGSGGAGGGGGRGELLEGGSASQAASTSAMHTG